MYDATLRLTSFSAPSPDWDHEHCTLCGQMFSDTASDGLREGYLAQPWGATVNVLSEEERTTHSPGARFVAKPTDDEWICPTCFDDFQERFRWSAI